MSRRIKKNSPTEFHPPAKQWHISNPPGRARCRMGLPELLNDQHPKLITRREVIKYPGNKEDIKLALVINYEDTRSFATRSTPALEKLFPTDFQLDPGKRSN